MDLDWFVDPFTPAQRRKQIAVPDDPHQYKGTAPQETRAAYRTRDGALAVPVKDAFGHSMVKGQAVTILTDGLFGPAGTELGVGARSRLERLAVSLEHASKVRCEGYVGYAGTTERRARLSRSRAQSICDVLADAHGDLATATVGYGAERPAVVGGRAADRELDRRVVVEMTGTQPAGPQVTVPSAPTLEDAFGVDGGVVFFYTPPADDGGSPVTGYQVNTGSGWAPVLEAPSRRAARMCRSICDPDVMAGLVLGLPVGPVSLQVRAVNAVGAGSASLSVTSEAYSRPSAPTGLEVSGRQGTITTTFGAATSNGGTAITGYQISYDGGDTWATTPVVGNAPWSVVQDGFADGAGYDVAVRARNRFGAGASVGMHTLVVTVPDAPTRLTASAHGATVELTFEAPGSDGGRAVTGYEVSIDEGDWSPLSVDGAGALTATLTAQAAGLHVYAVRAVNDVGSSETVSSAPVDVRATPTFYHGYNQGGTGTYVVFWSEGNVDPATILGWELSIEGGPWLAVTVDGGAEGSPETGTHHYGTVLDAGCASTGGDCTGDFGAEVRAVTTDGHSDPSAPGPLYYD